ncbi:polymorphic toxin type 34 domain-containing protein [Tengunoibacter tsumagoiensis]|uniref:Bacterial toxin 34 domain-containing protein n=1 Tax=Tengunoibacter tsumagoiensis TaxID=2014871 RepID=A0A402A615_9CHLR|nr:polymorphic toxin type 34 domain-containing protein [Tengunoibacter tsumagoiensis]GCE14583.1 hypothetical protein KTT_44420 [Tengunoibacter tsumagoiensis]
MGLFSAVINGITRVENDMESLASHAFNDLEALGISIGGDIGWLVHFLIDAGEDPVTTISHLCSKIESMGGEVGSTLGELASGIMTYGLTGFAQKKVKQAIAPLEQALKGSTTRSQAVASVHQTTIQTMQTKLDALQMGDPAGKMAWQGESVASMQLSFTSLSGGINNLTVPLEGDGAQARLNQICEQALIDIIVAGTIVVVLEIVVTAIVAVVGVETGPGEILILGGGAALIAETLEVILFLIGADLLIWLLGTIAIYTVGEIQGISTHPMSKGGNKNVGDTGIENEARALIAAGAAASMCEALANLMDAAKGAKDTKRQQRIKATQKKYGCRHKGGD